VYYLMVNIKKTDGKIAGSGLPAKKTIALHHWLLYYSFAGFLLLLLWNPVFKPVAFQKAPPVFFRHFLSLYWLVWPVCARRKSRYCMSSFNRCSTNK